MNIQGLSPGNVHAVSRIKDAPSLVAAMQRLEFYLNGHIASMFL